MRFIHAADVHIDSPLRGLESYPGAPVERLRRATREAFENLVSLAISERVAFVLIAGDLFDGKWPDVSTGVWTASELRRLERESIPVVLIRGNHDAASQVRQAITWPANVRELAVDAPETVVLAAHGVAVHGQGFAAREVSEDLAANYPPPRAEYFNIGLLHTSLTGDPEHDAYAPTSPDALAAKAYDYWALGHVHQRRIVREQPFIAFSGNTQGRHARELGAKGCFLVEVTGGAMDAVFRPTDTLRWHSEVVELNPGDDAPEDAAERVRGVLGEIVERSDGRFAAVRLTLSGIATQGSDLWDGVRRAELVAEIRSLAGEFGGSVWIEKVRFDLRPAEDVAALRRGTDLWGALLRDIERAGADDAALRECGAALAALGQKGGHQLSGAGISFEDPEQLRRWLREAEGLLVAHLREEPS